MKTIGGVVLVLVGILTCLKSDAQHCAPIMESYLNLISLSHERTDGAIELQVEYTKVGGQPKAKYQVYLLAYLAGNDKSVPLRKPGAIYDDNVVWVVNTTTLAANKKGRYEYRFRMKMEELANQAIRSLGLNDSDLEDHGHFGFFKKHFRLAVFVPFLEDKEYSVLKGLPEDKHECNYRNAPALLFQKLPYSLSIHFSTPKIPPPRKVGGENAKTSSESLRPRRYYVQINHSNPFLKSRQE